ncbi:MAG: hypothetical protein JWN65_1337 [Solirubrobacterales bacterium]|nr:hypothetical protein [Solirubrobacterales bacterium]
MRLRHTLIPLTITALAATASSAQAVYFKGEAIDTSAQIKQVGDLDVARDGGGAVAYVKSEGGVDRIFVSRLVNGVFQPPERVDAGLSAAGADPVVAASDTGRLTVVFVSGGQVYAVVRPLGAAAFSAPQLLAAAGSSPSVDMSINGVAYTSFTSPGGSAADVRVARLNRDTTNYTVLPDTLDIDPARDAGNGTGASEVAVSADGTAVVVWGEGGHVYGRRVFDGRISVAPQDLSVDQLNGHAGNTASATDPHIDIEDDSSFAWVTFRQGFDDGISHTVARRLVGSQFEAPVQVDGAGFGGDQAASTNIEMNGRGEGLATTGTAAKGAVVSLLHDDTFFAPVRVNQPNNVAPIPTGDLAENNEGHVAWMQGVTPLTATVHAVGYDIDLAKRTVPGALADTEISNPDFGPVDVDGGLDVAVNRVSDAVAVFVQGIGDARRLVSAGFDRKPGILSTSTTSRYRKLKRPQLAWSASFDLWGPLTYRPQIDGVPVGETAATRLALGADLTDGVHSWTVTATDRRGQTAVSKPRVLRVDSTPPALALSIAGVKRAGRTLSFTVKASDPVPGSGLRRVVIAFGDGRRSVSRTAKHVFRRGGSYTVRFSATDKAGNATVVKRVVKIRKSNKT